MTASLAQLITIIILALESIVYLAVLVNIIRRRNGQEFTALLVGLFTLVALIIQIITAMSVVGNLPQLDEGGFQTLQIFGTLFLVFILTLIARAFLRLEIWTWLAIGLFWTLGLIALDTNLNQFQLVLWTNGQIMLRRDGLPLLWAIVGWLIFIIGIISNLILARSRLRQPTHRNRLSYWTPILLLVIINDGLILSGLGISGNPLRLLAALLAGYAFLTHELPDALLLMRGALIYIITTLLIAGFYLLGSLGIQPLFSTVSSPLIIGAIVAIALAVLFTPLLGLVQRLVDRLLHIDRTDASRILHQYSESISNILDLDKLASVAVGLIIESMGLQRGFLFLVDMEMVDGGRRTYRLRPARTEGEAQMKSLMLDEFNPLAVYVTREQRPILQFDLDLLSSFRSLSSAERAWFGRLEAEVYAPIFANRRWIGMLALGAKLSGNRFNNEELVTVGALANQTAVALENARLVENLMKLNTEVRQAYRDLDKANRDLERLDQTKSDFISIASHELRTPLTVLRGYTEMLLEDKNLDPNIRGVGEALHKSTLRLHEVMDSMFDIAQIDARAMQLNLQQVDTANLVREVATSLKKPLTDRKLSLNINLPQLPTVRADPNTLQKVFSHLLNNAIKFTPDNGRIEVTAAAAPPDAANLPHGGIQITVSDTGVGVDPEFRDMIFTKFYQPGDLGKHSTSKSRFKGGGAGLGLALSKGIVEAHGGRIWVESPGYSETHFPGSKFHILLPLTKLEADKTLQVGLAVNTQIN